MKPYYVELHIGAVVMAENETGALIVAQKSAKEIVNTQGAQAECATKITSIAQLQRITEHWEGDCVPYGAKDGQTLFDMLPDAPAVDTRTIDMFATLT